jgi:predicted RecB family nuclease
MNIPHVGKSRARLLYKHGMRTAEDVAMAHAQQIAKILSEAQTTKTRNKVRKRHERDEMLAVPTRHERS